MIILEDADLRLNRAVTFEYLYANGLGGYASSTIVGMNTRSHHGLLVAAKQRMMFLLQKPMMNQSLTPRQNLTYYLKLRGIENSVIKDLYTHAKRLLIHEFLDTKSLFGEEEEIHRHGQLAISSG